MTQSGITIGDAEKNMQFIHAQKPPLFVGAWEHTYAHTTNTPAQWLAVQPPRQTPQAHEPASNVENPLRKLVMDWPCGTHWFFKSRVWREGCGTIEERVDDVLTLFDEYSEKTLERVWQSLFKRYNQVLRAFEGNDSRWDTPGFNLGRKGTI